ncbi:MAG: DUF1232 domain-containing protein [Tannerella sp.]|jgi:uncharacterized membrane protein YkvA (DUF1232 family)|nr:DUF1232 domain-containing protein [Tannerella sp.]
MKTKESIFNYQVLKDNIFDYAGTVGRIVGRPVLLLYCVLKSPDTPKADKLLIISALSYLVLPVDLISARRLPVIGWIDEVVSIAYVYQKVCRHITPEIEAEADEILDRWFAGTEYEIMTD